MTEWIELADFPRTFASQCAPWGSAVRLVKGAPSHRGGKPETLSGAKAFLQRLEAAFIQERPGAPDVASLVDRVLTAHARHLDAVEWCRVRGDELDLALRVYGARGVQRLHLALTGPVGRYADEAPPERATPAKSSRAKSSASKSSSRSSASKSSSKSSASKSGEPTSSGSTAAPIERVAPPTTPLLLRPLVADARPSYGDPIARDLDGRVHLALRLPDHDAYASVDPSGAVTVTPLVTRAQLREVDVAARTGGMLPGVHTSALGLVRVDHYESGGGEQERIGLGDLVCSGRRGLWSHAWALGVVGGWFLRCITRDDKSTLTGVSLETGKRARVPLPEGIDLRGAAIDHGAEGLTLRLLDGVEREVRMRLEVGAKVTLAALDVVATGLGGIAQPVPDSGGWVVAGVDAGRCAVHHVSADRRRTPLFVLPPGFEGDEHRPWAPPTVTQVAFGEAPRWQVDFNFGADDRPRCVGALVFADEGRVLGRGYVDADGALALAGLRIPLAEGEHVVGFSAGPTGDLAAALSLREGLALAWVGP
ncbi:MAG: hypothetical protein R3B09_09900 [Nannocystaceae bacterium]